MRRTQPPIPANHPAQSLPPGARQMVPYRPSSMLCPSRIRASLRRNREEHLRTCANHGQNARRIYRLRQRRLRHRRPRPNRPLLPKLLRRRKVPRKGLLSHHISLRKLPPHRLHLIRPRHESRHDGPHHLQLTRHLPPPRPAFIFCAPCPRWIPTKHGRTSCITRQM